MKIIIETGKFTKLAKFQEFLSDLLEVLDILSYETVDFELITALKVERISK